MAWCGARGVRTPRSDGSPTGDALGRRRRAPSTTWPMPSSSSATTASRPSPRPVTWSCSMCRAAPTSDWRGARRTSSTSWSSSGDAGGGGPGTGGPLRPPDGAGGGRRGVGGHGHHRTAGRPGPVGPADRPGRGRSRRSRAWLRLPPRTDGGRRQGGRRRAGRRSRAPDDGPRARGAAVPCAPRRRCDRRPPEADDDGQRGHARRLGSSGTTGRPPGCSTGGSTTAPACAGPWSPGGSSVATTPSSTSA